MNIRERLIVSLDFEKDLDALSLVDSLGQEVVFYKVGMQLFYHYGASLVQQLKKKGKKIFLDLKLHDIPNTIVSALGSLRALEVDFINMHTLAGKEAMSKAKAFMTEQKWNAALIGVTVLTSLNQDHLHEFGFQTDLPNTVMTLCQLAKSSGLDGVVSSAQEASLIKQKCGSEFKTICPGIRRATDSVNDQQRIMTPALAMENSADYIVVGRPIIKALNPKQEALLYFEEMEKGIKNAGK